MLFAIVIAGFGAALGAGLPPVVRHCSTTPTPVRLPPTRPASVRPPPTVPPPTRSSPAVPTSIRPPPGVPAAVLVAAGVFGLLAASLGADPALPAFLGVAAVGVVLAFVDLACLRLPDPLVLTMLTVAAGGLAGTAALAGTGTDLVRAGVAGLACLGGYVVLALLPRSRLGFGDVKLGGVLGVPLGWLGWDTVAAGMVLPHLLNGPVALVLLLTGRAGRLTGLPFGPALLAGALLAVTLTT